MSSSSSAAGSASEEIAKLNTKIDKLDAKIEAIENGVGLYGKLTEEKRGEAIAACNARILAVQAEKALLLQREQAGHVSDAVTVETLRLEQEKCKRDVALAQIKRKIAAKGASARDTSTIHTPVLLEASQSSTAVLIEGQPATAYAEAESESVKRYAGFFASVVSASGWSVSFHPSPHPTVMKLLGRDSSATIICSYTPEGLKNAYCALIEECESKPAVFLSKHEKGELTRNYYAEGYSTPSVLYK
jgi:hypothetical protein